MIELEPESKMIQPFTREFYGESEKRVEGAIQTLVDHPSLNKLTHLQRWDDARKYARIRYRERLKEAIGKAGDNGTGFEFPNMERNLAEADLELKDSYKQGTRKLMESMTHIIERGDGGGRGLFGRRHR